MVDDASTFSLDKRLRFGEWDPLRILLSRGPETIIRVEAVVGIGENKVTVGKLNSDSFKPLVPTAVAITNRKVGDVERFCGEDGAYQNAGLLYRTDRPATLIDQPLQGIEQLGVQMPLLLWLLDVDRNRGSGGSRSPSDGQAFMPVPSSYGALEHGEQNVDRRPLDPGGKRLGRGAAAHGGRRGGQLGEGRAARPRRRDKPPGRAPDGRGRRRAQRHDGASARSRVRRRNVPPGGSVARGDRRFIGVFSRPRARSILRRWTEMPKRARTSSTRSLAVSSGCSLLAVCSASTTSSLSLSCRRGPGRSGERHAPHTARFGGRPDRQALRGHECAVQS